MNTDSIRLRLPVNSVNSAVNNAVNNAVNTAVNEVSNQTARAMLRLVPNIDSQSSLDKKGFSIFIGSVFGAGLLALLMINTAANQDAFILADLKDQLSIATEQREATLKELQRVAAPDNLAKSAQKIGMIPGTTPKFLYLPEANVDANPDSNGNLPALNINPAADSSKSSTEIPNTNKSGIR